MDMRSRAVAVGLTAALALGSAAPCAYASPQSELAEAADRLEALGGELAGLQENLAKRGEELEMTSYKIGEKEAQIAKTQADLEAARSKLGGRIRSSYKSGPSSLIAVILEADSLSDIASRIYYMDKVAESDADAIGEVETLKQQLDREMRDLEKTKAEQEKSVKELEGQVAAYGEKIAEAQQYYDALDAQVQAELEAQRQAEENARIQAALEAAAQKKAQEEAQRKAEEEAAKREAEEEARRKAEEEAEEEAAQEEEPEEQQEAPDQESEEPEDAAETENEAEDGKDEESDETSTNDVPSNGGLETAYAAIGCPYVYGAAGPGSFDCSGLVCYCYGWDRGRTTYAMIDSLKADGSWKTSMDQLSVGDLVFTHAGHVGIYIGGGEMIHAPTPGQSVCKAPVYSFYGGGTF